MVYTNDMNIVFDLIKDVWQPDQDEVESISDIVTLTRNYSSNSLAFVVFKTGTVVASDTDVHRPDDHYYAILSHVMSRSPDFNVRIMNDKNFTVHFEGSVAGIVLNDHYKKTRNKIVENLESNGLMAGEKITYDGSGMMPSDRSFIGLYARAKLFKDVLNPEIVERCNPV